MVNCPGCGKPLRREQESEGSYFCENECCSVVLVMYPYEPGKTRITYTGFTRYRGASGLLNELSRRSAKHRLRIF